MKKNLLFIKNMVSADFTLINLLSKTTAKAFDTQTTLGFKEHDFYAHLNLLSLNKNLKQLLRALQYLKQKKSATLTIYCQDLFFNEMLTKMIKTSKFCRKIFIRKSLKNIKLPRSKRNLLLLLDVEFTDFSCLKQFYQHNFFLINKINTQNELRNFGSYKIFNEIKELKKVIFLIVLIKKILEQDAIN
jgi:hypothetical protein